MGIWILIIIVKGSEMGTSLSVEFGSKQSCEKAVKKIGYIGEGHTVVCVNK